jgi:hypothetical protein
VSSLAESNPHLRDPERLAEIIAHSAWESSVFEGARGLPRPKRPRNHHQRRPLRPPDVQHADVLMADGQPDLDEALGNHHVSEIPY